jgi:hypothetical protein
MPAVPDLYDAMAAQIHSLARDTTPRQPATKRQSVMIQQGIIPTYYNLSGPTPGTVVGIVLGSVAGFLLIVWLLYSLTQGGGFKSGGTTAMAGQEEIIIKRPRRNSHGGGNRSRGKRQEVREVSRSPRRSGGRSQIIVEERRAGPPPMRPRSVVVESRQRVPNDDVVEVIEEHEDYRERRGSRRAPGGYR